MVLSRAGMLWALQGEVLPKNTSLSGQKPKLGGRAWSLLLLTVCLILLILWAFRKHLGFSSKLDSSLLYSLFLKKNEVFTIAAGDFFFTPFLFSESKCCNGQEPLRQYTSLQKTLCDHLPGLPKCWEKGELADSCPCHVQWKRTDPETLRTFPYQVFGNCCSQLMALQK